MAYPQDHGLGLLFRDMRVALSHLQALVSHLLAEHVIVDLPTVLRLIPVAPGIEGQLTAPALRLGDPYSMADLRELHLDSLPRDRRLGG